MPAPVASEDRTIDSILEDLTNPSGNTVSNIFSASFSDSDNDKFVGIAIIDNASTSSDGEWQWSNDGVSNWTSISSSGLSDSSALFISEKDSLRFLPASNFNGTLDVHN